MRPWRRALLVAQCSVCLAGAAAVLAQVRGPEAVSPDALQAAIDQLGNLDFPVRMEASRLVRRTPGEQAVPALTDAVAGHDDGYVRFRALVLLTGFNDPRTRDVVRGLLDDPNNRVREVAYAWYEHNPEPGMVSPLLVANEREEDDFLRPVLFRALSSHGSDPRVRDTLLPAVKSGQDFFRSAVIEALGDYRAAYAVSEIIDVANLDGPLQDDAAIALGRIGDERALGALAALQRTAPQENQPAVAAAICLLGVNCDGHETYVGDTLRFAAENPGFQALVRGSALAASVLASRGSDAMLQALFDVGGPSDDPVRAPVALATATAAIRNTPLALAVLEGRADRDSAIALLADGFDMLEEDFEEERFFVSVRAAYWRAEEDSVAREVTRLLIERLEF